MNSKNMNANVQEAQAQNVNAQAVETAQEAQNEVQAEVQATPVYTAEQAGKSSSAASLEPLG